MRELNAYVGAVVRQQPDPPRSYDRRMLWHIVRDPSMIFALCIGVLSIVGVPWMMSYTAAWLSPLRLLWYLTGLIIGVIGLMTPFVKLWEWHISIRRGRMAVAEAVQVTPMGEDAVSGIWVVRLPAGTITERRMIIDAFWASDIREGSRFRVLLHPTRPRILVPIGP
jgi:hypothetical protein